MSIIEWDEREAVAYTCITGKRGEEKQKTKEKDRFLISSLPSSSSSFLLPPAKGPGMVKWPQWRVGTWGSGNGFHMGRMGELYRETRPQEGYTG